MTEGNGTDDVTRRIDPDGDETRAFDPATEDRTQRFSPGVVERDAAPTERLALPPQRNVAGWLIALAIVVALGVGVALGYSQETRPDRGVVARALVGPQGGVMEFGKIGRLEVPPDALPTATAITIRKVTNTNRVRIGPEGDPRSSVHEPGELQLYAFEPADLRFQQPVKITIPRPNDGEGLLIDTPDGALVIPVTTEGDRATIETDTFAFDR